MVNLWKSIWNLNCPSKIKHFIWRACKGILPTNHCLAKRSVATLDKCVLCRECESIGHILWSCRIALEVWKVSGIKLPNGCYPQEEFIDIVWKLKEGPSELDWELFATKA